MPHLSADELKGLAGFVFIAAVSEILAISYAVGTTEAKTSIAFIPVFCVAIVFPPAVAIATTLFIFSAAELLVHKREPLKKLFNVAQITLSAMAGIAVFNIAGGKPGVITIPTFAALAAAFFLTNQLLLALAITSLQDSRLSQTFLRVIGTGGSNIFYDLLVSPIVVLVLRVYQVWDVIGLLIAVLPLLLIRHSYFSHQQLLRANRDMLRLLIKTIETRDPYTSGHSIRVAELARAIAEDMRLSPRRVDKIETAALVHDIGKIDSIYADIIQKEGSLSESERQVIVTHAAKGAEFLKSFSTFPKQVIDGVRHHHERYDGTGYPDGLVGEAIPLESRIIMLCDSIDAMLSDRPYRRALSIEKVRQELVRCSGTQFDPRIVQVILKANTLERAAETAARTGSHRFHSPNQVAVVV